MASREEFLNQLWKENINACMQEQWIDNVIREGERSPNSAFSDVGPVLKRLLALGASRRELSLIARQSAYISYAQQRGSKSRDATLRQQVLTDPHSPSKYQALTVRNLDAWYPAFDVKPGEKLYLTPDERVRIW